MRISLGILFLGALVFSGYFLLTPKKEPAEATAPLWQEGASIVPRWDSDFGSNSFRQSVANLASTGANTVTLVIPYYQSNIHSTDIQRGTNTPTDSSLISGIKYIHSLDMRVSLKLHLETYDGKWRAFINPSDRDAWFNAYGEILDHYARIATENKVEQFIIGAELISMTDGSFNSTNTSNWKDLISNIREIYSGKLSYSANWGGTTFYNEKNHIEFWDQLDFIGIAAYFHLNEYDDYTIEEIKKRWDYWNRTEIKPLSEKWNKPIMFTEVGYRSMDHTLSTPPEWQKSNILDEGEQSDAYEALFSYWKTQPFMIGVDIWDWKSDPSGGEPGNTHFTPQNKLAQQVMTKWFDQDNKKAGKGINLTAKVKSTSKYLVLNRANTFNIQVANKGDRIYAAILDIEIYDSKGNKVYQEIMEAENFNSNETKKYTVSWTPTTKGKYKVKLGIFNNNWTRNYYWNDNALILSTSVVRNNIKR